MTLRLSPTSAAGEALVERAEGLLPTLFQNAASADAANRFCEDNIGELQRAGIAAAFVPQSLGGPGLESIHDWLALIATLARGDGSAAIAINMHFSATRGLAGVFAANPPDSAPHARAKSLLDAINRSEMLICSTTTERGTDNLHPLTEAVPTDNGWLINGAKYFVTMSPIATHIAMNVRVRSGRSTATEDQIANVLMPMTTPGIEGQDDWDALGMRGSGSQSVRFENCEVARDAVRFIAPWGRWSVPVLIHRTLANTPLVAAFAGIAQSAYDLTIKTLRAPESDQTRQSAQSSGVVHSIAEIEIAMATCQSMLAQIGRRIDDFMRGPGLAASMEQAHALMKDYQSVKWVVNQQAIEIVNKAMDIIGGGAYMARNPLTRLYRDVRAGPFMQPYARSEAREYVGNVMLEQYPER